MVNLFDRASARLVQRRRDYLAKAITYQQGTTTITLGADGDPLTATIGKTEFQIDSGTGVLIGFTSVDFLIAAEDLPGITPVRGDKITLGAETYTLLIEGIDQPWKWSDASARTTYRIHTKRTA